MVEHSHSSGGGGQSHFYHFLPILMLPKMEKAVPLGKIGKNWQKLKNIRNDIEQ